LLSGCADLSIHYVLELLVLLFLKLYGGLYVVVLLLIGLAIPVLHVYNLTELLSESSDGLLKLVGILIVVAVVVEFYGLSRLNGLSRGT
jgi:hypothetical protein